MINILLSGNVSIEEKPVMLPGHWLGSETNHLQVFESDNFDAGHWSNSELAINDLTIQMSKGLFADFNSFNNTNYSLRYWQIIALNWLTRIVRTIYGRIHLIEEIKKNIPNCAFHIEKTECKDLFCNLSSDIFQQCETEKWNNEIYRVTLDELGHLYFSHSVQDESLQSNTHQLEQSQVNLKEKFKKLMNKLNLFNTSYIVSSYLPKHKELLLNLTNFQFPTFIPSKKTYFLNHPVDQTRRAEIIGSSLCGDTTFEKVFKRLIPNLIPTIFLENFEVNKNLINQKIYPKKPRFIFTSNAYDCDDQFKIYAAEKVEKGTKYYVGQHGNFFNTVLMEASLKVPELTYSDKYLTWGNVSQSTKTVTAFPFTLLGRKPKLDENSELFNEVVIIMAPRKLNRYTWDVYREYNYYLQSLKRFHDLSLSCKTKIIIRPHNAIYSNKDIWAWIEKNLFNFHLENRKSKGILDYKDNSLLIFTYDSTGIVESLSLNKPCLAFWNPKFHQVYKHLDHIYSDLYENRIFFASPELAAKHVLSISEKPYCLNQSQREAVNNYLEYNANTADMNLSKLNKIFRS